MTDRPCPLLDDLGPELALGILDGDERAAALRHVAGCPACQQELADLTRVADALQSLTPAVEPSAGFESRVLSRQRRTVRRRRALIGAVAAAAALAVGLGGWGLRAATSSGRPGEYAATASLVEGTTPVGQLVVAGGAHQWMSLAVHGNLGDQTVVCRLREAGGKTVVVGKFTLWNGAGYWAAPVPGPPAKVLGADLVDPEGGVVARATFHSS